MCLMSVLKYNLDVLYESRVLVVFGVYAKNRFRVRDSKNENNNCAALCTFQNMNSV